MIYLCDSSIFNLIISVIQIYIKIIIFRYPNLNWSCVRPHQVKNLYTGADPEYINKIVMISEQNSKRYGKFTVFILEN